MRQVVNYTFELVVVLIFIAWMCVSHVAAATVCYAMQLSSAFFNFWIFHLLLNGRWYIKNACLDFYEKAITHLEAGDSFAC